MRGQARTPHACSDAGDTLPSRRAVLFAAKPAAAGFGTTLANNIVVTSAGDGTVIIDGGGTRPCFTTATNINHISFSNLTVQNGTYGIGGLGGIAGNYQSFDHMSFANCSLSLLSIKATTNPSGNFSITNSTFTYTSPSTPTNGVIFSQYSGGTLVSNTFNNVAIYGGASSSNITIDSNRFGSYLPGIGSVIQITAAAAPCDSNIYRNNIIDGNFNANSYLLSYAGTGTLIYNNLFLNSTYGVLYTTACTNTGIFNNTFLV